MIQPGPRHENLEPLTAPTPRQVNVVNSQVGVIGDYAQVGEIHFHIEPPANPRERRNRAAMLQLVRNTWVKGVLEQSLHGAVMLELGMEYNPEAVDHPWDMVVQMPERPDKAVPPGTRIVNVFDELGGSLLILGGPGAGKTTMLLELARDLIALAEQDETLHIPVVFNLSSWAVKQLPLEEWLIEELRTKYYIPKKIAQAWIKEDTLLLLLDGLDEVKAEVREKCVAAINTFLQAHLVPLAVCSRTADYEALAAKLHLQSAICLHPLTPAQIDAYLAGTGIELQAVCATLQHDPSLQEMAQSPLFLSIMTLAYRNKTVADLQTFTTSQARRHHLFDTYVERMIRRRSKGQSYTLKAMYGWLTWIATHMIKQRQSVFLIENLQPHWLSFDERRQTNDVAGTVGGLILGGTAGFGDGLVVGLLKGWSTGFLWGISTAVIGGLIGKLIFGRVSSVQPIEKLTWSNEYLYSKLVIGLIAGMVIGVLGGIVIGMLGELFLGLLGGFAFLLLGGLVGVFLGGLHSVAMNLKTIPNQAIVYSIRSFAIVGFVVGLVSGLVGTVVSGLMYGWAWSMVSGLVYGLGGWVFGGMLFGGGRAVVLHYTLRYVLAKTDHLPWRLVPFLNYCVDRIFLRRVGGGYIFIHRLLQEHFASLTPEDIERLATNAEGGCA